MNASQRDCVAGSFAGMYVLVLFASLLAIGAGEISNVVLNNGVKMPMLALQPEKYPAERIEGIVKLAVQKGITNIDTGTQRPCQLSVGAALNGLERSSYFLTSAFILDANVSGSSAYATATSTLQNNLVALRVDHVDLMLVSRPATSCRAMQEQWRALEDFYAAGKARAIGVRVYCPSSLNCIMRTAKITPVVSQVFYHVGMGLDPGGFISAFNSSGVVTQSIRALDSGSHELIAGKLVSSIGKAHGWTGAQVSMRWVLEHGVPLSLPMSSQSHMEEALAIFRDHLAHDEIKQLDIASSPKDSPSFWCTPVDPLLV